MLFLSFLAACGLQPMAPDQPCLEVGYAISSRTFDCSEDGELANERFERFTEAFECIEHDLSEVTRENFENPEKDLFHCAFAIRMLTCSEVAARGDDLLSWMDVSPACALVLTPMQGELPDVSSDEV